MEIKKVLEYLRKMEQADGSDIVANSIGNMLTLLDNPTVIPVTEENMAQFLFDVYFDDRMATADKWEYLTVQRVKSGNLKVDEYTKEPTEGSW